MDPTGNAVLGVLFRWIHISSVVILLGGVIHARLALVPAKVPDQMAARYRPWILGAMIALVISGLYNLFTKPALPLMYLAGFGLKMLLVLHIFAVAILLTRTGIDESKRSRWMTGIVCSGLAVIMISAWLRWISLT
jgi:hypothetical protein